ncbi:MAG: glucose-1-phosphate adenylyltransferase subunit GlgD [Clostridia bacterium]|nr:glucose-1-phosphate adenylyltransferase subunit GlgD [Clostridia bacterium]
MSAAGIIFSNIHDENISELTRIRTIASVPFGCRYRLIDFALSNMVNSNISNINVITNTNYNSLFDHLGSGKDWDLSRRSGGLKIFPPNMLAQRGYSAYNTRLGTLRTLIGVIESMKDDYVVMSDCDVICNIDFRDVIAEHVKSNADMTLVVKNMKVDRETAKVNSFVKADEGGRITDVIVRPNDFKGTGDMILNMVVIDRKYLYDILCDAQLRNYTSFTVDIIARNVKKKNYMIYRCDGHFACISSLEHYFAENMALIKEKNVYDELFGVRERPIYTKVRNSAPTYYGENSLVKDSLVADGCVIEGEIENCILFRGVKIGRGAKVKNSILFQDVYTGEGVSLNYVIADKNVVIRDSKTLAGCEKLPFYIEKGKMI